MLFTNLILLGAAFLQGYGVAAHAADETLEAREYTARYQRMAIRDLEKCQGQLLENRELHRRTMEKREAWVAAHVEKRGIVRRSMPFTKRSEGEVFKRQVSCVLAPEVTIGPYYLENMPIRKDNREGEPGIEMLLEIQFVNVATCQPVAGAYIDAWHANATGVYSGFRQENTLGETQLRSLQPTDADGIAKFTTIWPGHYQGRAVHTHIMARTGGTVSGNTYVGGNRAHIGQIFYDQDLITQVTKVAPYSTNRQRLTTNARDFIFRQQSRGYDALADIELIGNTIADGVVASIVVGIRV